MVLRALSALISLQLAAPLILQYAPPPTPPENSVSSEVIVLNVAVDENGRPGSPQVTWGAASFTAPALSAVRAWIFQNKDHKPDLVSVTFLFRARTIFPDETRELTQIADKELSADAPPLPIRIVDPGFLPTSIAEGVVIMQLTVDEKGIPGNIRLVDSVPSLDYGTINTVRQWRFRPALRAGRPVPGTAIVAISYLRPVIVG